LKNEPPPLLDKKLSKQVSVQQTPQQQSITTSKSQANLVVKASQVDLKNKK